MQTEPNIDIEQPHWRAIPPELKDGLSRQRLSKSKLRSWMLVLQAKQIPCKSLQQENHYQLLVPVERFADACSELLSFEKENHNWPPPPPAETVQQENTAATIWVLIFLGLFHILIQQNSGFLGYASRDWYSLGSAHAEKILDGQWWRLVTALTLHSGGVHLASNIIIGGLFINRLCRDLGSGLGWSLVLTSGVLGNLANTLVQSPDHRSIGASTAVFGAVGLLATINMLRYRTQLRRRWPLPIAAGCALLALLGAGGENVDIGAHLFGFLFGVGLGLISKQLTKRADTQRSWSILSMITMLVALFCWWAALS